MYYLVITFFVGLGLGYYLNGLKWKKPDDKRVPKWVQTGGDLFLVTNTTIHDLIVYAEKTKMPISLGGVPSYMKGYIFDLRNIDGK